MLLHLFIKVIITCSFLIFAISGQILGIGKWTVLDVQPCENDAEMPWTLRVRRYKLNHTHDAYDADFNTLDDFDDSVAIRINSCMMIDDGCKPFQSLEYECARILIYFAARNNVRRCLEAVGVDPPDFPVPQGNYHLENFVLDMRHLNNGSLYGDFKSEIILVKDKRDVSCMQVAVRFERLVNTDDEQ